MSGVIETKMRNHIAVVDLGFGDSGKGTLVARLCATDQIKLVAKSNGGAQCAHNVVTEEGKHFTFAQFGSGTFSNVSTYLTSEFMFEPFALLREAEGLTDVGVQDPLNLMHVAWNALMTTPYHWILNKWQEDQRGEGRHGSTGRGIGMTAYYALERPEDAPVAGDLNDSRSLYTKLIALHRWTHEQGVPESMLPTTSEMFERYNRVADRIHVVGTGHFANEFKYGKVVYEPGQGVLLDEDYGFHPHTTWSKATDHNARALTERLAHTNLNPTGPVTTSVIGVARAYSTRHGHGPFVTESDDVRVTEPYNDFGKYQGEWRQGHLDLHALRYAISACQRVDGVYITHTDSVDEVQWCEGYEVDGEPYELQLLDPQDFEGRQAQTESLYKALPVLTDAPKGFVAQEIATALGRPLYGWGFGPQTDQGMFQDSGEWF